MDEQTRLIEMMRRMHDGDAWHGPSVMSALEGVDAARALARPIVGAHSIWELVLHITAWRREVTRRLRGKAPTLPEEGDWPTPEGEDNRAWQRALRALDDSHRELVGAVERLAGQRLPLDEIVGPSRESGLGTGVTVGVMVHGVVQHDAYHAGQISLLKKG